MNPVIVLLASLAAALFLTGLAWFLQVVHLPLMLRLDGPGFAEYARIQRTRNTALMAGPMLIELTTAAWLVVVDVRGSHRDMFHAFLLVAIVWIVTFASIVPLHSRLTRGYDARVIHLLVRRNWIRVACWTLRSAFLVRVVWRALQPL